jgi:uncharacterized membrane protein
MNRDRLTAFTDGVIAVIITIMVLELKPPHGTSLHDLLALWPVFASYVLSFLYVAIYWNNHHHFFHLVEDVSGSVLWANLHLLFWISLIPVTTAWLDDDPGASGPAACYGVVLLVCAIAWYILQMVIIRLQGSDSQLKRAIGSDWKGTIAPVLYVLGIGLSFLSPVVAELVYAFVALLWLVPDKRVEGVVKAER